MARYVSNKQAIAVRTKACELAAQMMAREDADSFAADRAWAWATFFESYIAHGGSWTKKHFGLAKEETAPVLKMVKGSA